jgi:hypothetical protein
MYSGSPGQVIMSGNIWIWPDKTLPAIPINDIGTALRVLAVTTSHNAVVADASALPAAVPESGD